LGSISLSKGPVKGSEKVLGRDPSRVGQEP
jgi:hypothetical protein